eukprot:m.940915 g.940915  ORF g.940915 m.940915 type:complete len:972 (+) comp23830_c3_seq1:346-3261(+)
MLTTPNENVLTTLFAHCGVTSNIPPGPPPPPPVEPCAKFDYQDAAWRTVDTPHDWSIEDLPNGEDDTEYPEIQPRYGSWKLKQGDDPSYSSPTYDDSQWAAAKGGTDWRAYGSAFAAHNVTGWYRQHLTVTNPHLCNSSAAVTLSPGIIMGSDETYLNGIKIGATGNITTPAQGDYTTCRSYSLPAGLLHCDKDNTLAIRVKSIGGPGNGSYTGDGNYPGGLFDDPDLGNTLGRIGPFDAALSPNGRSYGFSLGGVGWYRKAVPTIPAEKRAYIRFDGVYDVSEVYINGVLLGVHPYGYTTFQYDLTPHLTGKDVIAVKVLNEGRNSRWYSGSGIYRHVWLTIVDPVHINLWGVRVQTTDISGITSLSDTQQIHTATAATVAITVNVTNDGSTAASVGAVASVSVAGASSAKETFSVAPGTTTATQLHISVSNIKLWSPDSPTLYSAAVTITSGANTDVVNVSFGFRTIKFSAASGFQLNGVTTKLQGGCVHHANGPLGAAAIDRADERRVETLKKHGYNAIRTSHNPVSPAFLDACDRLGIMVMDEAFDCWEKGKNTDDYHVYFDAWWQRDLQAMVHRDTNHPSVIMWSIGNEIPMRGTPAGYNLSKVLSDYVRVLDSGSGRAVTSAYPFVRNSADPFFQYLDVAGYNYSPDQYQGDHNRLPERIMVGTESFPKDSYEMWSDVWSMSWVIGDFIWTAMDYLGETSIGHATSSGGLDYGAQSLPFPWHDAYCGDIDLVGHQKPQSVYRTVLWGVVPISMLVHAPSPHAEKVSGWGWPNDLDSWTWPVAAGTVLGVRVFAKGPGCDAAVLSLNGKRLGTVAFEANYSAYFNVPYAPGTLTAACNGSSTNVSLTTATHPVRLELSADRQTIAHSKTDLSYVTVSAVSADGQRVPTANAVQVTFGIEGAGILRAVGNGNPADPTSVLHTTTKSTWRGRAVAVVQPSGASAGDITLTASAPGLTPAKIVISTTAM